MTSTPVGLTFDQAALLKSLRFAFANKSTVLQELLQNARRAGATRIEIDTAANADRTVDVTVSDDGHGIVDFQRLLCIGGSGWDNQTREVEHPYGLGFLGAIYSAKSVEVVSLGQRLLFETDAALGGGCFNVEPYRGDERAGVTTWVTLRGIDVPALASTVARMVTGFPVPVRLNGTELERPDADGGDFVDTPVGRVSSRASIVYDNNKQVYLQGFRVGRDPDWCARTPDIVHLDSRQFSGKFPDRDRVVDEADMLKAVNAACRDLHLQRLLRAKTELAPVDFLLRNFDLARSLSRLDVFNDIDLLPLAWLKSIAGMPCDAEDQHWASETTNPHEVVTREQIASGAVRVFWLSDFTADDDPDNARRWVLAYASKARYLSRFLDDDHWIYPLLSVCEDTAAAFAVQTTLKTGRADPARLQYLGPVNLILCSGLSIEANGQRHALDEPVADWAMDTIYVPVDQKGHPTWISSRVLRQLASYQDDDGNLNEQDLDADEAAVNQMVRELAADTPETALALILTEALSRYRTVRSLHCAFDVDAEGKAEVTALRFGDGAPLVGAAQLL